MEDNTMHKILLFVLALVSATSLWAKPTFGPRAYTYEVEDGERLLLPAGTSHMPVFYPGTTAYIPVLLEEGDAPLKASDVEIVHGTTTSANFGSLTVRTDADVYKSFKVSQDPEWNQETSYWINGPFWTGVTDDWDYTWPAELWYTSPATNAGWPHSPRGPQANRYWICLPVKGSNGLATFTVGVKGTDVVGPPMMIETEPAETQKTANYFHELSGKISVPRFRALTRADHTYSSLYQNSAGRDAPFTSYEFSRPGDSLSVSVTAPEEGQLVVASAMAQAAGLLVRKGKTTYEPESVSGAEGNADRAFWVYNQPTGIYTVPSWASTPIYRVPMAKGEKVTIAEEEEWEETGEYLDYLYLSRLFFFPKAAVSAAVLGVSAEMVEVKDWEGSASGERMPIAYGTVEGSGVYKAGETVTLKAVPYAGATFDKWEIVYADTEEVPAWLADKAATAGATLTFDLPPSLCGEMEEERALVIRALWKNTGVAFMISDPIGTATVKGNGLMVDGVQPEVDAPETVDLKKADKSYYSYYGSETTGTGWTRLVKARYTLETPATFALVAGEVENGKISGLKTYTSGQTAKLTATPSKGYVFANWDITGELPPETELEYDTSDLRNATISVTLPSVVNGQYELNVSAYFVKPEDDQDLMAELDVEIEAEAGSPMDPCQIYIGSYSKPVVTISGLPKGVVLNTRDLTLSGTPEKPGTYEAKITCYNASVPKSRAETGTLEFRINNSSQVPVEPEILTDGGTALLPGVPFERTLDSLESALPCTVSGLPKGLKWNSTTGTLSGTPTVPGDYTLFFTHKEGKAVYTSAATLSVAPLRHLTLEARTYNPESGEFEANSANKVSGLSKSGDYTVGSKVSLKATPGKNYIFAGWYCDQGDGQQPLELVGLDARNASGTYLVPEEEETALVGLFYPKSEEQMPMVVLESTSYNLTAGEAVSIPVLVDSYALPVVSVENAKMLPPGLKFDAKALAIVGTPTMPGTYEGIRFKATNSAASGSAAGFSDELTLTVTHFTSEMLEPIPEEVVITPGITQEIDYVAGIGCSVTGLPKGMKWDSKKGILSGTSTVPGNYVLIFSKKVGSTTHKVSFPVIVEDYFPTLTLRATEGGTVNSSASKVYAANTKVTLRATPLRGYVFAGWYDVTAGGDGTPISEMCYTADGPYEPTVDYRVKEYAFLTSRDDVTLEARFVPASEDTTLEFRSAYFETGEDVSVRMMPGIGCSFIPYTVNSESFPTVKVSNLPAGLKFDAKTFELSGAPKTPGTKQVTFTATKGKTSVKQTVSFEILPLPKLSVKIAELSEETLTYPDSPAHKVSGAGAYIPGKKVTLKATPAKNYVFAGWYQRTHDEESGDWETDEEELPTWEQVMEFSETPLSTSISCVAPPRDVTLYAVFIAKAEDTTLSMAIWNGETHWRPDASEDPEYEIDEGYDVFFAPREPLPEAYLLVYSYSATKVSVKGLPPGVTWNASTGELSGTPTKPGIYPVTISASNASGVKKTWTARIKIGNVDDFGLDLDCSNVYTYDPGTQTGSFYGESFGLSQLPDALKGAKVSGLPSGMKWDVKNATLSGIVWKAGYYTITFTKGSQMAAFTVKVDEIYLHSFSYYDEWNPLSGVAGEPISPNNPLASTYLPTSHGSISYKVYLDGKALPKGLTVSAKTEKHESEFSEAVAEVRLYLSGTIPSTYAGEHTLSVVFTETKSGASDTFDNIPLIVDDKEVVDSGTFYALLFRCDGGSDLENVEDLVFAKIVRSPGKGTASLVANGLPASTLSLTRATGEAFNDYNEVSTGRGDDYAWSDKTGANRLKMRIANLMCFLNRYLGFPSEGEYEEPLLTYEGEMMKGCTLAEYNESLREADPEAMLLGTGKYPVEGALELLHSQVRISGSIVFNTKGECTLDLTVEREGVGSRTVKCAGGLCEGGWVYAGGSLDETLGLGKTIGITLSVYVLDAEIPQTMQVFGGLHY